ncbi:MAG: GNAT family N-acetyltransferase [Acidobacteriota bacterium]
MDRDATLCIEQASEKDVPLILTFIHELAKYERLSDSVTANEERLRVALFGPHPYAEAVIAYQDQEAIAFALYYFNYSSFSGLPGLYLEDIFVQPPWRGSGAGRQLFGYLAQKAIERGCGRMEWAVLNWNETAIRFYKNLAADPVQGWTVFRLSREHLEPLTRETKR